MKAHKQREMPAFVRQMVNDSLAKRWISRPRRTEPLTADIIAKQAVATLVALRAEFTDEELRHWATVSDAVRERSQPNDRQANRQHD